MPPSVCPACNKGVLKIESGYSICTSCVIYRKKLSLIENIAWWAGTKQAWWRLPILLWFCYIAAKYLQDNQYAMQRTANIINAFDFGIHELGHLLFLPFGQFMTLLGGSLFQIIFPLVWLYIAVTRRWYFASTMILCWVGFNVLDVAAYAADAQARLLPLATLASDYDSAHDWYQILSRTNLLDATDTVALIIKTTGVLIVLAGLIFGTCLLGYIALKSSHKTAEKPTQTST